MQIYFLKWNMNQYPNMPNIRKVDHIWNCFQDKKRILHLSIAKIKIDKQTKMHGINELPHNCPKNKWYCVNLNSVTTTKFINKGTTGDASNECTTNKYAHHKSFKKWISLKPKLFGNRYNRTIHYSTVCRKTENYS